MQNDDMRLLRKNRQAKPKSVSSESISQTAEARVHSVAETDGGKPWGMLPGIQSQEQWDKYLEECAEQYASRMMKSENWKKYTVTTKPRGF